MNITITDSHWDPEDLLTLYEDEPVEFFPNQDLSQLMVAIGAYPSTSKARNAGRVGDIPPGWTEYKANKIIGIVYIWNPTEPRTGM